MTNETIKTDDAIFNAALSVLGEWPATRECSMRARMHMAADMQDRIMDTVNALLTDKKRSAGGKLAADKRWAKAKAKAGAAPSPAPAEPPLPTVNPGEVIVTPMVKRGRPRKITAPEVGSVAPVPLPPSLTMPEAVTPPPPPAAEAAPAAVPPLPPMPSATPPAPAPSANPFGTVQ